MGKRHRYVYEEVKEIVNNLGYELISKEYYYKNKIIFKDKEGYYYFCMLSGLIKNKTAKQFFPSNPYTIQNIKLWCKLNNKSFELLSDTYIDAHKDLKWKCLKEGCGEEFGSSWNHINNNRGCPFCNGRQVGLSNCLATKNPELVKQWHPTKNGDLTPWDVTCGNDSLNIWWQCSENQEHKWQANIHARYTNKSGCPYCSGRYATKENNLLVINPELCEEWDYEGNEKRPEEYCPNSNDYAYWICKSCGRKWYAQIASRNIGRGCLQCNESKGEKEIDKILTKYNIHHDSQYKFSDLRGVGGKRLKFDSAIFWNREMTKLRMLIEYDGEFHYEDIFNKPEKFKRQQLNDQAKNTYCKNNNINLLRIPYWDFNKIEEILIRELNILLLKEVI